MKFGKVYDACGAELKSKVLLGVLVAIIGCVIEALV